MVLMEMIYTNNHQIYKKKLIEVAKTLKEMYSQIGIDREMKLKEFIDATTV